MIRVFAQNIQKHHSISLIFVFKIQFWLNLVFDRFEFESNLHTIFGQKIKILQFLRFRNSNLLLNWVQKSIILSNSAFPTKVDFLDKNVGQEQCLQLHPGLLNSKGNNKVFIKRQEEILA